MSDLRDIHQAKATDPHVYLLRMRGTSLFKIGYSGSFRGTMNRVNSFDKHCPYPVDLVAVMPGGIDKEQRLHADLNECRTYREWFDLDTKYDDIEHLSETFGIDIDMHQHTVLKVKETVHIAAPWSPKYPKEAKIRKTDLRREDRIFARNPESFNNVFGNDVEDRRKEFKHGIDLHSVNQAIYDFYTENDCKEEYVPMVTELPGGWQIESGPDSDNPHQMEVLSRDQMRRLYHNSVKDARMKLMRYIKERFQRVL